MSKVAKHYLTAKVAKVYLKILVKRLKCMSSEWLAKGDIVVEI